MATPKKNKKGTTFIVIVVVLLLVMVLLNTKTASGQSLIPSILPNATPDSSSTGLTTTSNSSSTDYKILKKGSSGTEVKKLQHLMNIGNQFYGKPKISVDGNFGPNTATSLYNLVGLQSVSYTKLKEILTKEFKSRGLDINDYL